MVEEKKSKRNWHPLFDRRPPTKHLTADAPLQGKLGRCITVASQKGGVGKTTTAVNLAAGIGLAGSKALLLDLDPQANATSGVGESKYTFASQAQRSHSRYLERGKNSAFLEALEMEAGLLPFILETEFENLWAFPSFQELSDLQLIGSLQSKYINKWKFHLEVLRKHFDFILMDCPPSLGGIPTLALSSSDAVMIPVQCEYYAMEGLSQILPVIEDLQATSRPDLKIAGLLLTMYASELELANEVVGEIQKYFPRLVYRTIIPRDVALAESASHGLPIFYYQPLSRGAWSYLELTREVLGHE